MGSGPLKKIKIIKLLLVLIRSKIFLPRVLKYEDIKKSKLVISGRFHGLCLALKYGVPCISVESNTHKQKGMLIDIGLCVDRFLIDIQQLDRPKVIVQKVSDFNLTEDEIDKITEYQIQATRKINIMFEQLQ